MSEATSRGPGDVRHGAQQARGPAGRLEDAPHQERGGGLAAGARDAADLQSPRGVAGDGVCRQGQGLTGIGHHEHRHRGRRVGDPLDGDRAGPRLDGLGEKSVAVDLRAGDGDEEVAGADLAGILDGARHARVSGTHPSGPGNPFGQFAKSHDQVPQTADRLQAGHSVLPWRCAAPDEPHLSPLCPSAPLPGTAASAP